MSCSHLIDTFTNAKYIYRGVSRFRQTFVCGKCSGCISKQRTDWRVRAYYESLDCLRKPNAFVLFDTLTYTDDSVPHYSDIYPDLQIPMLLDRMAFSRPDVQKFFKRLRINLKRAGYNIGRNELRYILTSEFGSSENCTHRPHYHILFFITFPIQPIELSRIISRSWPLGKTDGVRPYDDCNQCPVRKFCRGTCIYHSDEYVKRERLVTNSSPSNTMKCVNYVTKYISKDMYLSGELQTNVDLLWRFLSPDYQCDYLQYRKYRKFCSQVLPFHLQSIGFGQSLIGDLGKSLGELDYLTRTNQVHLPTGKKDVVRSVALPRYYQRKLYYDFVKEDGGVRWFLHPRGIDTKVAHLDHEIAKFMRDYRAFDDQLSSSRLFDLALYKCVYKGTLTDYQSLYLPYKEYYRRMLRFHDLDEQPLYINKATKRDRMTIGSFLSTSYSVTSDGEILYKGKQLHKEFIPYDGYVVVNDKVCRFWYGFDRKLAAFDRWKKIIAVNRDIVQYNDDVNLDYYKSFGLLDC